MLFLLLTTCGSLVTISSCGDPFGRGETAETPDLTTTEISFSSQILPALKSKCSACHSPSGAAGGTSFVLTGDSAADHAAVATLVNTDSPADSKLLQKGTARESHGGGGVFTESSSEYQTIKAWVTQGAPNN